MDNSKKWDRISGHFDTYKKDVWPGAADNIATVWPVILDVIHKNFPEVKNKRALDFGCGAGMFCQKLNKLGFNTTGIDLSEKMINIGKENLAENIDLYQGNSATAKNLSEKDGKFDVITAIMVLQFMPDDEIKEMASTVAKKGYLIFANHNPKHLDERGIEKIFTLSNTDIKVSIHKRTVEDYDRLLSGLDFTKILEKYPLESKEFLQKYNILRNTNIPKYMVVGYQKA